MELSPKEYEKVQEIFERLKISNEHTFLEGKLGGSRVAIHVVEKMILNAIWETIKAVRGKP